MFLIIFGYPELAKTHHVIVLGLKDCTQGYNVQVYAVATLSTELCEVKVNYRLDKLERLLSREGLLAQDEQS